jgi:ribosomal protein L29
MKAAQINKNLREKDVTALTTEVKELQKAHFGMRMQ